MTFLRYIAIIAGVLLLLFCCAVHVQTAAECESRGGIMVESMYGTYECVERR